MHMYIMSPKSLIKSVAARPLRCLKKLCAKIRRWNKVLHQSVFICTSFCVCLYVYVHTLNQEGWKHFRTDACVCVCVCMCFSYTYWTRKVDNIFVRMRVCVCVCVFRTHTESGRFKKIPRAPHGVYDGDIFKFAVKRPFLSCKKI
jgi:hypothetical protein